MITASSNVRELLTGEAAIVARKQRGMEIAASCRITEKNGAWVVPSMTGGGRYVVRPDAQNPTCTCPDHETRHCRCKHIFAVEFAMKRETTQNADGSTTVTETVAIKATERTTYAQNWPAYNAAQQNEKREFQSLLADLCRNIPDRPQGKGRPRLPIADAVFAVVFKVYSTFSGRRFTSDLCDAKDKGYLSKVPHYNSVFDYFDDPEMSEILTRLIVRSSLPMQAIESDFAADSTGFATSRFIKWFDHKYGTVRQQHDWVKAHMMTGVKTNIVTACEIHDRDASDTKQLPALVETTAANFTMREVSADKGYSSIKNHDVIAAHGATPFIAFKSIHSGKGGGLWEKMFHYFSFNSEDFLAHYHKRSNVESTVMMIKTKFGDGVRSKTDVAMKNEVLAKVLAHNICCLISAMYELGLEPMLGNNAEGDCPKSESPARKMLPC